MTDESPNKGLQRFALLSIAAALTTFGLKTLAWRLTNSVGLLSDALESIVNLVAALVAWVALAYAARPPDKDYEHGYDKAEYFSSGIEGGLIAAAAVAIAVSAVRRWLNPAPLESVGLGLGVSVLASAINGGVALVLLRAGKKHQSITLEADAHHLLTDVWTSAGVLIGVGLVAITGRLWLDPLVALLVALNILVVGVGLVRRSLRGLLDRALPVEDQARVRATLTALETAGASWHVLRTRQAGARRFVTVHVLVPGDWTVQRAHDLVDQWEAQLRKELPRTTVTAHIEPREDPASHADGALD